VGDTTLKIMASHKSGDDSKGTGSTNSGENNNNDPIFTERPVSIRRSSTISKMGMATIPEANIWSKTIARYPLATCLVLLVLNLAAAPLAIIIRGRPDFSNPKMGLEARGIMFSEAEHTWRLLDSQQRNSEGCEDLECDVGTKKGDCKVTTNWNDSHCPKGEYEVMKQRRRLKETDIFEFDQDDDIHYHVISQKVGSHIRRLQVKEKRWEDEWKRKLSIPLLEKNPFTTPPLQSRDKRRLLKRERTCPGFAHKRKRLIADTEGGEMEMFSPTGDSVGFSYREVENETLWTVDKINGMCETGKKLRDNLLWRDKFCMLDKDRDCCPSENLASIITDMWGKKEECNVTQKQLDDTLELIKDCWPYRAKIILVEHYWIIGMVAEMDNVDDEFDIMEPEHRPFIYLMEKVKEEIEEDKCKEDDILPQLAALYEYFLDKELNKNNFNVQNTNMFFATDIHEDDDSNFYNLIYDVTWPMLEEQYPIPVGIKVIQPRGRFGVFDIDLTAQLSYAVYSFIVICCLMVFHNGSYFISLASFGMIFLSLSSTVFVYQIILAAPYFPFMNMVCLFILIAIGVDDVFIYTDTWFQSYVELPEMCPLENRIQWTLSRAGSAMLMTSITTAIAFFSNFISTVTAIRLFSMFSAVAIMMDYLLMLTMLPCILVLKDKMCGIKKCPAPLLFPRGKGEVRWIENFYSSTFFDFIKKLRYFLVIAFTGWGCFCTYETFNLPDPYNVDIPLWVKDHPLEIWNLELRPLYEGLSADSTGMPVRYVFGYRAKDNGIYLDPQLEGRGTVEFLDTNFGSEAAQEFYLELCKDAMKQDFVDEAVRVEDSSEQLDFEAACWPLAYQRWIDDDVKEKSSKCDKYPVKEKDFEDCMIEFLDDTGAFGRRNFWWNSPADVKLKNEKKLLSVNLTILTKVPWKAVYNYMGELWKVWNPYFKKQLANAPTDLPEPFWFAPFRYFALQTGLIEGAYLSCLIALILAAIIAITFTRNFIVAFLAIQSIFFILTSVVACMKWLDWTIGVNESVIFAMAVGVAVDFVLHLGHSYTHATQDTKDLTPNYEFRTRSALGFVGISVTMACVTTVIGGSAMTGASVLFFNRFGVYLCIAMLWSWIFSLFHFPALLAIFGPNYGILFGKKNPPILVKPHPESIGTH